MQYLQKNIGHVLYLQLYITNRNINRLKSTAAYFIVKYFIAFIRDLYNLKINSAAYQIYRKVIPQIVCQG